MSIPLYEDFSNPYGEFLNYDTYVPAQKTQIARQKHVNIRSFMQSPVGIPVAMFTMRTWTQTYLSGLTMGQLATADQLVPGEAWTTGTVGPLAGFGNFPGISLNCTNGLNASTSVMPGLPVNIAGFTSGDYISVTLPSFPASQINLAASFLDISSDSTGSFASGQTDSLALTGLTAGNVEARFPWQSLTHSNLSAITAVRLRLTATGACTVVCLAIRCMAATWAYAANDINTLYSRLERTVPPTGTTSQVLASTPWPTLLFSDGASGPRLSDSKLGFILTTGSNTLNNFFALYLREGQFVTQTQAQLGVLTMAQLATQQQPGTTPAALDDLSNTHAIELVLSWGGGGNTLSLFSDTNAVVYTFVPSFAANSTYYVLTTLSGSGIEIIIYPMANGVINWAAPMLDTTLIKDWSLLPRRVGRIGWWASLADGNTYIQALRPWSAVYGEYRSAPLLSDTPVRGAQLFASASGPVNLLTGFSAEGAAQVALDNTKSTSGDALAVMTAGAYGGVQSNPIRFENFGQTVVEFDLYIPPGITIEALLVGQGVFITLAVPPATPGHWAHYAISLESVQTQYPPGVYSLLLYQHEAVTAVWYLDNAAIFARSVAFAGRAASDPWGLSDSPWIPFNETINSPSDGAQFAPGKALQVRGQAVTQDTAIDRVTLIPQYAELGNFVWPRADTINDITVPGQGVEARFAISHTSGTTYQFTAAAQINDPTATIVTYAWDCGDGTIISGASSTASHTYAVSNLLNVVKLTITDSNGNLWYGCSVL